ncbi:MAG TPA: magnesium transporter [Paracoccus sp. (in: a-proteobacteria)]|uniref:magnesium transporter n=1 Tax=uncultured Paracoccus sp. TaxID=189685 RepID=UPI00261203D3|nr:magnesium transporter [uncultured Paracoccus sp.]HMQ40694.1 magnesium transporter [Paracoccus sp. (in: a-proteobacteria)]HMR36825.1 magnesium transporter [Paracoccus sp. (in: a-proteobacteria)]
MQDDEQRLDAAEKPELVADKLSPEAEQPPEPPEEEDDFTPSRALLDQIRDAIDDEDPAKLNELLEPMHAADIADVIENLSAARRRIFMSLWSGEIDGDILSEIDESIRDEIVELMPKSALAEAVREMDSDDIVELIEELDEDDQQKVLDALDESDRAAVEQSLTYPEYSAGRMMQSEVVTAPEHWTVGDTIDYLRAEEDLPDQFYHVILVDPRRHPLGYVALGRLLAARRDTALRDLAEESFRPIDAYANEADVAYAFNQYHLISEPVVDEHDRLVGVITIDDAMEVLDDEHEEDILRLAGVGDESSISDTVIETLGQRLPWLAVNLLTAILASFVIAMFEDTISQIVALAVLMPIVASMGGNAGTQTLTVAVRALATKSLTGSNVWRVVGREAVVGLLNGICFALVMGVVAWIWFDGISLASVISIAMVVNLFVAALAGILVPLTLERFGADPALASGTFVTTVTDVVGFFAFLGLAQMVLL